MYYFLCKANSRVQKDNNGRFAAEVLLRAGGSVIKEGKKKKSILKPIVQVSGQIAHYNTI